MIHFTKMQGVGNDYVYINSLTEQIADYSEAARLLSNRHYGIGSDGLVIIMPSETCDFRMRMFNSDGSESEMCGNASICVAKYVYDKGLTNNLTLTLETLAGDKSMELFLEKGEVSDVRVDMGEPILECKNIPVSYSEQTMISKPIKANGQTWTVTALSMGNPHIVIFTKDVFNLDLRKIGPLLEHHELFPNRTNVQFVEVLSEKEINVVIWERGAGETLASGTGACASVVASVLNGHSEPSVIVHQLGGDLFIEWDQESNHVFMTGRGETVFEGITEKV
ncbi:MAG: diaminopimelate epimerase [Bacteroidales bacterium]